MTDILDNYVNLVPVFNSKKIDSIYLLGGNRKQSVILPNLDEEKILINNEHLSLKKSNIDVAGLGVFCNRDYDIDDIIEVAPVLRVQSNYLFQPNNVLNDYIFKDPFDENYKLVALGFGSMYNHSDTPNLKYYYHNGKMIYQAIKPIQIGDELYISYGTNWWSYRKNKNKI
jgi:hypothetical protein